MDDTEIRERLIALELKVHRLMEHAGLTAEEAGLERDAEDQLEAEDMGRLYGPQG